jgi:hypothetical protein
MAKAVAEVVDLVDSDSDDEVIVVSPSKDTTNKRSREEAPGPVRVTKQQLSADQSAQDNFPAQETEQNLAATHGAAAAAAVSEDASEATELPLPTLDDDGKDNAAITYGILKQAEALNPTNVFTCLGVYDAVRESFSPESTVQHIQQNDKFSCGYGTTCISSLRRKLYSIAHIFLSFIFVIFNSRFRNLQMILTSILPHLPATHVYFRSVPRKTPTTTTIPPLQQLQQALEQSWKAGFDSEGAKHYRNKIVGQTSKIGAVEVASVMAYWGMDSSVVQFIKCRASRALLPKFVKSYFSKKLGKEACPFCSLLPMTSEACAEELLQFASAAEDLQLESGCRCPLLPLYLQWEGHSVTIVGIEETAPGEEEPQLLVFDPLQKGSRLKDTLAREKTLKVLRLPCKKLLGKDIQIILSSMRSLSTGEQNYRRNQVNAVTAAKEAVMQAVSAGRS